MKAHLLFRDRDFDWSAALVWNADALDTDLSLHTLFQTMANNDPVVLESVRKVVLAATEGERDTILYRQDILRECLHHEVVVRELYAIASEAMDKEKKHYLGTLVRYPHWVLSDAVEQMEMFGTLLSRLRRIADRQIHSFSSEGWHGLFTRIQEELSDDYFRQMAAHLAELRLRGDTLISAGLGRSSKPTAYSLYRTTTLPVTWWQALLKWLIPAKPAANSFSIHPRDEAGARALARIRDEAIASTAVALAQVRDHVRDFFGALRAELAFYIGCTNLSAALTQKRERICFPTPLGPQEPMLAFRQLYDASLALTIPKPAVGNDTNIDHRRLVIVTGANQGGKSTYLRSIGLGQLMMQSGMFVGAESFAASICHGLFTHYKREESIGLEHGKFDEELARMSEIVDHLTPLSLILFNESFAATNEREGSEIAFQVMSGLLDRGVRIVCVTHLYSLARKFYLEKNPAVLFLRAERREGGARTFKLIEDQPLPTSFGDDLYKAIFNAPLPQPATTPVRGAA